MVKNQEEDPGLTETGTMWVINGLMRLGAARFPGLVTPGGLLSDIPEHVPTTTEYCLQAWTWTSIIFVSGVQGGQADYSSARASVGEIRAAW